MVGIFEHVESRSRDLHYSDFLKRFAQICEEHRRDGRALAFALFLYDFCDPHIIKVLRDLDFWRALDVISGRFLSVFSLHHSRAELLGKTRRHEWVGPGMNTQQILSKYFHIETPLPTPSLLFFQVAGGRVTKNYLLQLHEKEPQQSFLEIRGILTNVASSISAVENENRNNTAEIFALIETELQQQKLKSFLRRLGSCVKSVVDTKTWLKNQL